MKIDILTLFPEETERFLTISIIGRARERGHLDIKCHQIRDFADNKRMQVDDYPYGGGLGMVMNAEPLYRCLEHVRSERGAGRVIMTSPAGDRFTQKKAVELSGLDHLIIVCGRYEGVDRRFVELCCDEEISVGDFVLTGGEIAACAIADAAGRLIPGVLKDEESFRRESHWAEGRIEAPQYTRPAEWRGLRVPEVLLSGHAANIERWRSGEHGEST